MGKTIIYIRNYIVSPSGYYRIMQYINVMEVNFTLRELIPYKFYNFYIRHKHKIYGKILDVLMYMIIYFRVLFFLIIDHIIHPDTVIISREFLPRYLLFPVGFLVKKIAQISNLIWDFDDHILDGKEISYREFYILSQYSNSIVVTNTYLKEIIHKKFWYKVVLLPTTDGDMRNLNLVAIRELRKKTFQLYIRLVWVATSANLPNLMMILPILDESAEMLKKKMGKQLYLSVVSSSSIEYNSKFLIVENIQWSHDRAIEEMSNAHIGIMPLVDSVYSRGKGGFKLVQYMSVGLPVLASNVGFNKNIISDNCGILIDDKFDFTGWKEGLLTIVEDVDVYMKYSENAYSIWDNKFSFDNNLSVWMNLLKT